MFSVISLTIIGFMVVCISMLILVKSLGPRKNLIMSVVLVTATVCIFFSSYFSYDAGRGELAPPYSGGNELQRGATYYRLGSIEMPDSTYAVIVQRIWPDTAQPRAYQMDAIPPYYFMPTERDGKPFLYGFKSKLEAEESERIARIIVTGK